MTLRLTRAQAWRTLRRDKHCQPCLGLQFHPCTRSVLSSERRTCHAACGVKQETVRMLTRPTIKGRGSARREAFVWLTVKEGPQVLRASGSSQALRLARFASVK